MAGNTGEAKRDRLKRIAARLRPAPEISPFYVQLPDGEETRSPGWYMRRDGEMIYVGYSALDAELWIRQELRQQKHRNGTAA